MQRRHFVHSFAALSALGAARADEMPQASLVPGEYSTFDGWVDAARTSAREFLKTPLGMDPQRFVGFLSLWASALPRDTTAWASQWIALDGANERLEFSMLSSGRPFVVSALRMAPGCLLPAHCHPSGGGVTLCVDGSLTLEHFGLAPESPLYSSTGSAVNVRFDSTTHLSDGRSTSFTPSASNLHRLSAGPSGAIVVDVTVQWAGSGEFSYLRFTDGRGLRAAEVGDLLPGVWTGMRIADAYA